MKKYHFQADQSGKRGKIPAKVLFAYLEVSKLATTVFKLVSALVSSLKQYISYRDHTHPFPTL